MPQYHFQARSAQGQEVKGEINAATKDAVAAQLVGRGVTPIKIDEVSLGASYVRKINRLLGGEKVEPVDLIMFCRQMYTITKAGIPLTRGIRGLSASIKNEYFQEVLNNVAERLEAGVSLSQGLAHHPKVFSPLFISMINVGETSGKLDEVFQQIGADFERDEETKKRIKSAMRYPTFVTIALVGAIVAINIWVVPAFARMFEKFDADLPIPTKILIGTSNLFIHYWPYMLRCTVAAVVGGIYYVRTENGALVWGQYKLRLPIVGDLIDRGSMSRYARSFSLMLAAGVPITQSLNLCASAIDNPYLSLKIQKIREGIERGDSMLRTHLQAEMFTPLVLQMIAVGEESGQVDQLLSEVAEFYEREVDYDLKTLTDRIEPILIVVMAAFVTILALGIFLPMWNMWAIQS